MFTIRMLSWQPCSMPLIGIGKTGLKKYFKTPLTSVYT
jgi:hypothetical protein